MKILVTGHKGFIGSNLFPKLESLGHKVKGFEWGEVFPSNKFDLVIHLGAISSTNEKDVNKVMHQNYDFSVWLLEYCNENGINLQYSSSASVYGLGTEFAETSPVDPRSPYAWSKYMFERYVQSKSFNIKVQGFRYFNVHGPGEDHKPQPSPHHTFSKAETIKLFQGSYFIKRDFVPVEKIVKTHIEFMKVQESGIWNVGTGRATSFLEVAESFKKPIHYVEMPKDLATSYQYYTCSDNTKFDSTVAQYGLTI
jgi:ADP-L-glycero-D-manno-heptose 6-epimerase